MTTAQVSRIRQVIPPGYFRGVLVSRSRTATASNSDGMAPAANAVDADYSNWWAASSLPVTFDIDIAGLGLGWSAVSWLTSCDNFTTGVSSQSIAVAPGNYTIRGGNGGSFTTLKTVTSSAVASRIDLVNLAGYDTVRLSITQDAEGGSTPSAINIDVWNVAGLINAGHTALTGGLFTIGDSITGVGLALRSDYRADAHTCLGDQVYAQNAKRVIQVNAGHFGYRADQVEPLLDAYLAVNVCKWVSLNLGTNDAVQAASTTNFYNAMESMVQKIIAAGCVPVVPTIPWCGFNPADSYNAQIATLKGNYPAILAGPDLFAYFDAHHSSISGDNVHPTGAGYVEYLTQWVNWCVANSVN